MAVMVQGWQADDKSLHATEQGAKEHDFTLAFDAWLGTRYPNGAEDGAFIDLVAAIREDRMKLLAIFRTLNGGSGIPPLPPIHQPNAPAKQNCLGDQHSGPVSFS